MTMSKESGPAAEIAIEIRELHKYFGKLEVLKGIDFTVNRGEVVCVIGPSGSENRRCCAA